MRVSFSTCFITALGAAACVDGTTPPAPAVHLRLASGAHQTGPAGSVLPEPIAVWLVDDEGMPVQGVTVRWTSANPGARFEPESSVTGYTGMAATRWRLGLDSDFQVARAKPDGWDDVLEVRAGVVSAFKAVTLMRGEWTDHMCALDAEQIAWCWGRNDWGQLGRGAASRGELDRPAKVATTVRFTSLSGYGATTCGLSTDAELWCWGLNSGRFGNRVTTGSAVPVRGALGLRFASVDMSNNVCGIAVTGDAYCWGTGVLGDGTPSRTSPEPVLVAGGHRWRDMAVTNGQACGATFTGEVWCWAGGFSTQLGLPTTQAQLVPARIRLPALYGLSLGAWHQCGLHGASALCWARNSFALGAPVRDDNALVAWPNLGGWAVERLSTEGETTAGLTRDGSLWVWGAIPQCCDGGIVTVPSRLEPAGPWRDFAISGVGLYSILATDSTVVRWRFGFSLSEVRPPVPILAPEEAR